MQVEVNSAAYDVSGVYIPDTPTPLCHSTHPSFTPAVTILPSLINNMKYIVFGGGGQVALHFAKLAISKGHEVVSVVRDDSQ
jgi:hypothetical protein